VCAEMGVRVGWAEGHARGSEGQPAALPSRSGRKGPGSATPANGPGADRRNGSTCPRSRSGRQAPPRTRRALTPWLGDERHPERHDP
jgi:hypothetical protein